MKWFCIRKAKIPAESRLMFERYGVNIISAAIAGSPTGELHAIKATLHGHALAWLTEQFDRAERKETWSITMEAAITIFVAVETVIAIHGYFFRS